VPGSRRLAKNASGNVLVDDDCVALMKGFAVERIVAGAQRRNEISCKMDGISIGLKACFCKKA
jgi:protein PhnA